MTKSGLGGLGRLRGRGHSVGGWKGRLVPRAALLAGASLLAASSAVQAAPSLVIANVGTPTTAGTGVNKRAIWTNAGTVGSDTVDIVGVITSATRTHTWTTTSNRPSITSTGQDNILIEWRLYKAGTYNITTDSGGTLVVADVHVQFNDIDGPSNERVFLPVCAGDIQWARIDKTATTGRAFGTVSGQAETFSLIGDQSYNNEPVSGVEAFWPGRSIFKMGRTANNGFLIRLDNPTYTEFDTLNYECADFQAPVAADDSKEGTPGNPAVLDILDNDSTALENNNTTNNNTLKASEFGRSSVSLVAPSGATGISSDSSGDVIGFTVPGEGAWAYSDTTGQLTFTPDPSFKGYATQIKYTVDNALGITSNQATVTVWYPALGVTKTSAFQDASGDGYAQVGETIEYVYQVKAYGKDPIQSVTISETGFTGAGTKPVPAYLSGDANSDSKLDLSETWLYKAIYTLVAGDMAGATISNSATVSGQTPGGTAVSDVSDSANTGDGNGTAVSGPGPGNSDTTTTTLAKAPIAAANDSQPATIYSGAGASNAFGVLGNDTLKGVAATPSTVTLSVVTPASHAGVTLDTATGQVSVAAGTPAATYTIDYRICETGNPSNCADARATVVVTASAPIAASPDTPAPVIRATGGSGIINALTNDTLNGTPVAISSVNLTVTTPASHAGVTLDTATGLVSVAAGTPAGSYTIGYQICEKTNPANCASSTVTVVVQPNAIAASNDSGAPVNGASGNPAAFNAFTNDNLNGSPVVAAQITASVTTPATPASVGQPVPVLNTATGDVSVPAGTPAGTYTIAYKICETSEPANCSNASITVSVSAPAITAADDAVPAVITLTGGSNLIQVLANDRLNGAAITISQVNLTVQTPASNAGVTLDTASGTVAVAAGTPSGSYQIGYRICDKLNAANCATANVTVPVNPTPIATAADNPAPLNGTSGNASLVNAYANDSFNGQPVDLAKVTGTVTSPATAIGGGPVPALDPATGTVSVPPLTPAGTYVIGYKLCENANPANCSSNTVTVVVQSSALVASDDAGSVPSGASGTAAVINLFAGDTVGGSAASTSNAALSVASGSSVPSVLTFDAASGNVDVKPATPAGTYTFVYQICEKLNAANCKTANASVTVGSAALIASDDSVSGISGAVGAAGVINVFGGDSVGGTSASPANAVLSLAPGASLPAGLTFDTATGAVGVAAGTPAGSLGFDYQICETLNPANCKIAHVTVGVTQGPITAAADNPPSVPGSAGSASVINAFANDSLNGQPIDLAKIVATVTTPASHAGVTLDPASGVVAVAPNTPAGTYTIGYQICEKLNPANCASSTVTVVVSAATIAANPDTPPSVPGAAGNASVINAFANDRLNGQPLDLAKIVASVTTPASHAGVTLDPASGVVAVAPNTPAGTYTIGYQICEKLNPSNCASSTVTVVVDPAAIAANPDAPAALPGLIGNANLINAFANDLLGGQAVDPARITASVTSPAANAGVALNPANGTVSVAPGTPSGTYSIGYRICETLNPTNCADSTVTVIVQAAPIAAAADNPPAVPGTSGSASLINALANDTLNGQPLDLAKITATVTSPASHAGVTLDPASGIVAVAANTPAGTYTIGYQICEKLNPSNCASSTVTVVVNAAAIAANPDTPPALSGLTGNASLINAFANDLLGGQAVDPAKISATVTSPAANAGVSLNPANGTVSVAPGTPSGSYSIGYRICEMLNPANCAASTVTVTVNAAPIVAADDAPAPVPGIAGNSALINALANDSFNGQPINLAAMTLTVTAPASNPKVALDPASGTVSVAPNTPAGTYAIDYRICENLNPGNCATARVTVVVRSAAIAALADTPTAVSGSLGSASLVNAYANDTLNGTPVTPALVSGRVVTPASDPGVVLDAATGTVSVAPGTKAGSYTIAYEICEKLNPSNCATTNVTVVVEAATILALDDAAPNVRSGVGLTGAINVFANDKLNGQPIDPAKIIATVVTPAADPGITLDTATGQLSVAASVAPGSYTLTYQICEKLNPANCKTATVSLTVEEPISSISGTVFTDANSNGKLDPGEPRRAGWIVEIVRNGTVVATARTAADGTYSVADLRSGPGYSVVFRNPENNVVYDRISNVTLGANVTVVDQDQPIDPSGVIYDSITRNPIAGATVRLTDANGVPLPTSCFLDPSQAAQTTGVSGFYRFDLVAGAAAQCPTRETVYRISVTPPGGYASGSTVLLPKTGPFDPTGLPAPVRISPSATPPADSDPTFYLSFRLASGDPDVINNHIALDPFLTRSPLVVTKTSPRRAASIGDLVPYEITVRNTESARRAGVDIVDILPPGMKYVTGTAAINGTASAPLDNGRELVWKNQIIPASGSVRYNLTLVVGAGITSGERVNTGVAENAADGAAISNRGTAVVSITPSTVFDCSELLGKVFEDRNGDGYQDPGEPGVPGVRLATVNGQLITTDEFGRYHIACAAVPDARIGSNFVLKIDVRTLPLGWVVTTDNPRSIRLTRGKFGELNFGVASPQALPNRQAPPTTRREGGE